MIFFNPKEDVLDIELTQYGKYLLSIGKWKPVYYAFFDNDILYDGAAGGIVESQNDIETRIQDNTPRLRTQHSFTSRETAFAQYYDRNQDPTISEYAATTQTQLSSSAGTLPFRRIGIASGGESFGFMLEFLFLENSEIIDNPFAANTIIDSTIYNSTYNDRGDPLPSKVGMSGGITRVSWTYSF